MEEIMVAACSLTDSIKPIALAVILPLPARDPSPRIEHVPEPTYVQALVPQTSMKPLYLGVLDRFAGLDVDHIDDWALQLPVNPAEVPPSTLPETLALGGAVYKRKWEYDGQELSLVPAAS
jgi:hypothetical protein